MTCCFSVAAAVLLLGAASMRADPSVHTVFGTGIAGHSDRETTTPFGFAVGPDGALYFCEMDGQRVRRLDPATKRVITIAGTGERGYSGDGGPALEATLSGPKGLAYAPDPALYVADTENHAIRRVDLTSGMITTVLGTGQPGDGPEPDPRRCQLSRPHGLLVTPDGLLVADSEAHRIRLLR